MFCSTVDGGAGGQGSDEEAAGAQLVRGAQLSGAAQRRRARHLLQAAGRARPVRHGLQLQAQTGGSRGNEPHPSASSQVMLLSN